VPFRVTFRTTTPPAQPRDLVAWLTQVAEPSAEDGEGVVLRALPARFVLQPFAADLELQEWTPVGRLVDVLFEVSAQAGADLDLGGKVVNRSDLWLVLAEEQDRLRVAAALRRARAHGNADEVHRRLWAVLASLRPGHDCRWDATLERVVELLDVGEQVSVERARELVTGAEQGDVVQQPVEGPVHLLLWRWLSEAYPGVCEPDHSMH
jgi:hypothetical protein